jgi:hypothetical protein
VRKGGGKRTATEKGRGRRGRGGRFGNGKVKRTVWRTRKVREKGEVENR